MCVFVSVKFHLEKQTYFRAPLEQQTVWENPLQVQEEAVVHKQRRRGDYLLFEKIAWSDDHSSTSDVKDSQDGHRNEQLYLARTGLGCQHRQ